MDYLQQLLENVKEHPYATILAVSIVETRVTSIAMGALLAKGYVNPFITYSIFVTMSILGDTLYYYVGRMGNIISKFFIKRSWQDKLDQFSDEKVRGKLPMLLLAGKISGASKPIIVASGLVRMTLRSFYGITVPCTLVMYIVYMTIGYFFGYLIF